MITEAFTKVIRSLLRSELEPLRAELARLAAGRDTSSRRPDELLTPKQVAEEIGVTVETVREWTRRGELRPIDLGEKGKRARLRIQRSELERYLESRKRQPRGRRQAG